MFQHSLLRPVFITQFVFNIGSFLVLAIFVPYAVHHLGLSASAVGATLATYGIGMVSGGNAVVYAQNVKAYISAMKAVTMP